MCEGLWEIGSVSRCWHVKSPWIRTYLNFVCRRLEIWMTIKHTLFRTLFSYIDMAMEASQSKFSIISVLLNTLLRLTVVFGVYQDDRNNVRYDIELLAWERFQIIMQIIFCLDTSRMTSKGESGYYFWNNILRNIIRRVYRDDPQEKDMCQVRSKTSDVKVQVQTNLYFDVNNLKPCYLDSYSMHPLV